MKTVELKNGSIETKAATIAVYMRIEELYKTDPLLFYELVSICRDAKHQIFNDLMIGELKRLSLLQNDGHIHESIRNIVLSSVIGEDLEMVLTNPIVER
jgi:hypothetical protein